jgi:hypothetical protein
MTDTAEHSTRTTCAAIFRCDFIVTSKDELCELKQMVYQEQCPTIILFLFAVIDHRRLSNVETMLRAVLEA